MRQHAISAWVCAALLPAQVLASGSPPDPFFAPPPYIDMEYVAPKDSEIASGQYGRFHLLVERYAPYAKEDSNDYRHVEEEGEKDFNDFIAQLQKPAAAKGVDASEIAKHAVRPLCNAQDYASALSLLKEAATDPELTKEDYTALVIQRFGALAITCGYSRAYNDHDPFVTNALRTVLPAKPDNPYARYLEGARYFHDGKYAQAADIFIRLKHQLETQADKSRYAWIRETSAYMIARCKLNEAESGWDGYSDPVEGGSKVDQKILMEANAAFDEYLTTYPQGMYADSARNTKRRVWYISGRRDKLNAAINDAFAREFSSTLPKDIYAVHRLALELRHYFKGDISTAADTPIVLSYVWLGDKKLTPEDVKTLQARQKDFDAFPGLFRYLQALGYYKLGDYRQLLAATPQEFGPGDVLSLSTELLRARAFERLGETDEALAAFMRMHGTRLQDDAVELQLAQLQLNRHEGAWLYSRTSPLESEKVLRSVAQFGFSDDELRKAIAARGVVGRKQQMLIDELARRYALTWRFKELAALLAESDTGIFAPLKHAAATLARTPRDPQALADAGGFLYQAYITPDQDFGGYERDPSIHNYDRIALDELLPYCKPCKGFKERSKDYKPPILLFRAAVDNARRSGKKNEGEAKALHYLVRCERTGGEYERRCTWHNTGYDDDKKEYRDVFPNPFPMGSSKTDFIRLHKLYPDSPWTKKTRFYYD